MAISRLIVIFAGVVSITMVDGGRPPSIITEPPKRVVYKNQTTVMLQCHADGQPTPTIQWRKNDADVAENDPRIKTRQNGFLVIDRMELGDEGLYQCFATNQYGTAVSVKSELREAFMSRYPSGITTQPVPMTVTEGDSFELSMSYRTAFPERVCIWELASRSPYGFTNIVPVQTSARVQIAPNGNLHFAHAIPEDGFDSTGKVYKPVISNPYLGVTSLEDVTKVTVTPATPGNKPPTLAFYSGSPVVGLLGESVSLRCFFGGRPEPKVTWSVKEGTLPTGRYNITKYGTELVISNLQASDEREYICTGSNPTNQNLSQTIELRVEEAPRFATVYDGPRNVNVTEGSTVTVNCSVVAKPQPTAISWFRNGQRLDSENLPARYSLSKDHRHLTISNICLKCPDRDTGSDITVLQCDTSNSHGYAFRSGYININHEGTSESGVGSLASVATRSVLLVLGLISIRLL